MAFIVFDSPTSVIKVLKSLILSELKVAALGLA